jgi:hypothetical protein
MLCLKIFSDAASHAKLQTSAVGGSSRVGVRGGVSLGSRFAHSRTGSEITSQDTSSGCVSDQAVRLHVRLEQLAAVSV